uniref:Uncharacterized protein n=1 Tax=Timema bartmani TaxID=61472 RepID=A0A7R9I3T9_9NEOP|nr:unnamed protein product [Timema bartmani]
MWIHNVTIMVAILQYFITSHSSDRSEQADIEEHSQLVPYEWPQSNDRSEQADIEEYNQLVPHKWPHSNDRSEQADIEEYNKLVPHKWPHSNDRSEQVDIEEHSQLVSYEWPQSNDRSEQAGIEEHSQLVPHKWPLSNYRSEQVDIEEHSQLMAYEWPQSNDRSEQAGIEEHSQFVPHKWPHSSDWSEQAGIEEHSQLVSYEWPDCIPGIRKKGNTVKEQLSLKSADKQSPFYTACLKCGACLAIAEKRFHGSTTLMEAAPWSDLVPTTLDGMWTDKLKELCRFYLSEFGATRLYDSWWDAENYSRHDMITNLCRGEGVFRDCLNIVDKILLHKPSGKWRERPFGVGYHSTCCPCQ